MTTELQTGFRRRRRVRLVKQTETAECGLAAVAMVANYHGLDTDLRTLRRRFQPSIRGAPLKTLMSMADQLRMTTRAVRAPLERIGGLRTPAILHWNMNHYVVLEEVRGERALIHDPATGSTWQSMAEISRSFTGVALELAPADDFERHGVVERLRLRQLWRRVDGLAGAIAQTALLTLLIQLFALASPYFMQVALDKALPALDSDLLAVLALGFGALALINAATILMRSFVLLAAGTSLSYGISVNLARRLLRLPLSWFEKRHVGDVLSRFQSIAPVRQFMVEGAVAALLDGCLALVALTVMAFYSGTLAAVAVAALVSHALLRWALFGAQRAAQDDAIAAAGREQGNMIESLRGITTLRLYNREMLRHSQWQGRLTDAMNAGAAQARLTAWQSTGGTLLTGLENVVSIWLAVRLVIDGGFSVGMVFAYLAYKTQFLQKATSLVDQVAAFRLLSLHLERLADIALTDEDVGFRRTGEGAAVLRGDLELRDVAFSYGADEPAVLEGLDLVIPAGSHVAITGPSGGGKSTLVKVLLGLLDPSSGAVLVDGRPLDSFGRKNFHEQIGAVLQDDSLFAGTLAENIALFDDSPEFERILQAARAAALLDDIERMPMRFDTLVGDMGSSLSGGQRQRLLLARALYRQPRLLVLDEGTSQLDAARERAVGEAVKGLGITRIVIAHRLETIVAADRILRLEHGRLTDVTDDLAASGRRILEGARR